LINKYKSTIVIESYRVCAVYQYPDVWTRRHIASIEV
jgi:hypothetical protein